MSQAEGAVSAAKVQLTAIAHTGGAVVHLILLVVYWALFGFGSEDFTLYYRVRGAIYDTVTLPSICPLVTGVVAYVLTIGVALADYKGALTKTAGGNKFMNPRFFVLVLSSIGMGAAAVFVLCVAGLTEVFSIIGAAVLFAMAAILDAGSGNAPRVMAVAVALMRAVTPALTFATAYLSNHTTGAISLSDRRYNIVVIWFSVSCAIFAVEVLSALFQTPKMQLDERSDSAVSVLNRSAGGWWETIATGLTFSMRRVWPNRYGNAVLLSTSSPDRLRVSIDEARKKLIRSDSVIYFLYAVGTIVVSTVVAQDNDTTYDGYGVVEMYAGTVRVYADAYQALLYLVVFAFATPPIFTAIETLVVFLMPKWFEINMIGSKTNETITRPGARAILAVATRMPLALSFSASITLLYIALASVFSVTEVAHFLLGGAVLAASVSSQMHLTPDSPVVYIVGIAMGYTYVLGNSGRLMWAARNHAGRTLTTGALWTFWTFVAVVSAIALWGIIVRRIKRFMMVAKAQGALAATVDVVSGAAKTAGNLVANATADTNSDATPLVSGNAASSSGVEKRSVPISDMFELITVPVVVFIGLSVITGVALGMDGVFEAPTVVV